MHRILTALFAAALFGACSESGVDEPYAFNPDGVLALVADQLVSLPPEQQRQPWAVLVENGSAPFGIVKMLPLGDYGRIDLTRDCAGLYRKLSAVVLHAPDRLELYLATNTGRRAFTGKPEAISVAGVALDALSLEHALKVERVTTQVLGFEVFVDGERVQSPVQYVGCARTESDGTV